MQAIIFANRQGNELSPLNKDYCPALLSVGNKALVEYTIEDLTMAGVTQITLVYASQYPAFEQLLGKGEKWGVNISYQLSKPGASASQIMRELKPVANELLLIRGDILRSPCVKSFIDFASKIPSQFIQANMAHHSAGLQLHCLENQQHLENQQQPLSHSKVTDVVFSTQHRFNDQQVNMMDWPLNTCPATQSGVTQVLHGDCHPIDSLHSYLAANLALVKGKILGLSAEGRPHPTNDDLYLGVKTQMREQGYPDITGIVGKHTVLASSVSLNNDVVIGSSCFVDEKSHIRNSLILNNTFVGKGLLLDNCIVSKNLLINLANASCTYINDTTLLADTSTLEGNEPKQLAFSQHGATPKLKPLALDPQEVGQRERGLNPQGLESDSDTLGSRIWTRTVLVITFPLRVYGALKAARKQSTKKALEKPSGEVTTYTQSTDNLTQSTNKSH